VEGTRPDNIPPKFADANGRVGVWGESEFINLVRNPSGESAQPRIRPWVNRILGDYFPTNPSLLIGLLFNPSPIDFYYQATVKSLTQTFWAKFGWAQVILGGYRPYTALALITLGGFIGSLFFNWRNRKGIPWDIALFLGISLLGIWGLAVTRGLSNLVGDRYFLPVARYAYPVIIPTMLILNLGWLEIIRWIERYFRVPRRVMYAALILFFIGLNVISLVTIYRFFNA